MPEMILTKLSLLVFLFVILPIAMKRYLPIKTLSDKRKPVSSKTRA